MVYTVTLNPSLDKTLSVSELRLGEVHRAHVLRIDLGGKGVNVSRALQALGVQNVPLLVVAGRNGRVLQEGLEAAGFHGCYVEIAGETRQNITLLEHLRGRYTKINEPGPRLSPSDIRRVEAAVSELTCSDDIWVFSGSLPPGAPIDLYGRLIRLVQERGGAALLDSSGAALERGLQAQPFGVKPNSEEAADLLARSLPDEEAHIEAVQALQSRGVKLVGLSRGAEGLVLGYDGQIVSALPPQIPARSPVGAGDATLAGIVWALVDGCSIRDMARRAVASGAAAAMQEGSGLGSREAVKQLLRQVQVQQVR
ncbi:MAG: 1-phosphofructokinase [Caldilineae bacterium]|nr:MAG: 1-phosphofructokinase [Caldilineae bacterium]